MQDFFEPSSSRWHLWWILDTIRFSNASVQQRFFFQKANLSWHLFLDLTGAKRKGRFVDSVCVCVFPSYFFQLCGSFLYVFIINPLLPDAAWRVHIHGRCWSTQAKRFKASKCTPGIAEALWWQWQWKRVHNRFLNFTEKRTFHPGVCALPKIKTHLEFWKFAGATGSFRNTFFSK